MTDYSSPIPRRTTYTSPSNRSFTNPPPPDSALRDTTINVATAFSNAEQQKQQPYLPRSPFKSFTSSATNQSLGNTYLMSPSKRFSTMKRDTDIHGTLVDSDNDFFGQSKPLDYYGQINSYLSQLSSSDDDDDPFEEEELLATNPSEEELRRDRISGRHYNNQGGSLAGSSLHSIFDRAPLDNHHSPPDRVGGVDDHNSNKRNSGSIHQSSSSSSPTPTSTPQSLPSSTTQPPAITLALERMFKGAMFCIYMVFWLMKKMTVAMITFVFVIVSTVFINPVVYLLQSVGFKSLEFPTPLVLSAGEPPSSPLHIFWSVSLLMMASLWCLQWTYPDINNTIKSLSPSTTQLSHWLSFIPSTTTTREMGDDLTMMNRFATLEKTVHGLIKHMQKQDKNSQQQITSINWHLDQLQNQLTQWSTSQSKQVEDSLEEQMGKVEKVLAMTTTDWNDRLQQWESRFEQGEHSLDEGKISPILMEALRELFVSKSEDNRDDTYWTHFLKQHQDTLDQYVQEMMDQWIQEQQRQGKLVDMDTLNETLITQLVQPGWLQNDDNAEDGTMTRETNDRIRGWIDTAIQRYHQDLLGTPDYALSTRGAMIIHSLTSPTFSSLDDSKQQVWTKWYAQWTQPTVSPMIALTPGIHAGQCWPMKGTHGSLGIRLSEPIDVQAITVEYPSRTMVANQISSAPKQLEIWGIKDITKDFSMDQEHDNSIFLGSFMYDIKSSTAQTFSLSTNRYILFQGVVVRVLSNWGNQQYTCLYRVRVHGTTAM